MIVHFALRVFSPVLVQVNHFRAVARLLAETRIALFLIVGDLLIFLREVFEVRKVANARLALCGYLFVLNARGKLASLRISLCGLRVVATGCLSWRPLFGILPTVLALQCV